MGIIQIAMIGIGAVALALMVSESVRSGSDPCL